MRIRASAPLFVFTLAFAALVAIPCRLPAAPIPVQQRMGALHGFLLLYNQDGKVIAAGQQANYLEGNDIHARLTFHFGDGSLDEDDTVFRQGRTFHLIRDHHVQKGRSFPNPLDMTIDVPKNEVTWIDFSKKGGQTQHTHMKLPPDLVNGMVSLTVQNYPRSAAQMRVSYLVLDSGPRVVHFIVTPDGTNKLLLNHEPLRANRFNVHTDIGSIAGVVAPILGKQPPDFKLWVVGGAVPVFVKMTGALYPQGPVWTTTLAAPVWAQGK